MNEKIVYGASGFLVGILIGMFIVPAGRVGNFGYTGMMGEGRNQAASIGIDKHFIEEMIPHHEGAIAMANEALKRSKRPEILSLAKGIIKAQKTEISQMKNWYQAWYGAQVPEDTDSGMGMGMMGGNHMMSFEGGLAELNNAKDFDLEFIRQMIPHHEMAVMMAQMLASASDRSEMQEFAKQIIDAQSGEIELMRDWYADWSKAN